ncbi:MAG TPA: hypothetical protein P5235_11215 [Saprospiraceae bacterium]|nr:hypothetical protein [Saprospiraceae bacterium]HRX29948.1 hypothetical protein [Saprospiraceae bacterium]
MGDILVPIVLFACIFGVFYLYFTSRNRERMALIEKGADASIFYSQKKSNSMPLWKILTLNIAFLAIGVGAGLLIATIIQSYTYMKNDTIYPALIFMCGGLGLYIAYLVNKRDDDSHV